MIALRRSLAVVLGGAFLVLVGLAFATPPMLVPGVAFIALGALTPAFVWLTAQGARARRILTETQVVEGARFHSTIVVHAGPLGLREAELEDPLGGRTVPVTLPSSLRGERSQFEETATFTRRGLKRLDPPILRIADPLGLAPAVVQERDHQEVLVLPRTEPVRWNARSGASRHQPLDHGTVADALAASEIDGLRPYRPGTPAARIHWPALARGAGLLERRMRAEEDAQPLVVLDCRCPPDHLDYLDAAVRAAASLVRALAREHGCGLITSESGRLLEVDSRLNGWPAVHRSLALVGRSERAPVPAARRRPGTLFYVAAEAAARPPQLVQETGGILVLPAGLNAPGRWPVSFRVSGCVGYSLARRAAGRAAPQVEAVRP